MARRSEVRLDRLAHLAVFRVVFFSRMEKSRKQMKIKKTKKNRHGARRSHEKKTYFECQPMAAIYHDRAFHGFLVLKSVALPSLFTSETAIDGFWGSVIVKRSAGIDTFRQSTMGVLQ